MIWVVDCLADSYNFEHRLSWVNLLESGQLDNLQLNSRLNLYTNSHSISFCMTIHHRADQRTHQSHISTSTCKSFKSFKLIEMQNMYHMYMNEISTEHKNLKLTWALIWPIFARAYFIEPDTLECTICFMPWRIGMKQRYTQVCQDRRRNAKQRFNASCTED